IEISRGLYKHWVIYVGYGYVIHHQSVPSVISFSVAVYSSTGDTMNKENLENVAGNEEYQINNQLDNKHEPRPIEDILQEAESLVGRGFSYNVATSNCEHFATMLRYSNTELNYTDATYKCLKVTGLETVN
ncbi:HRAS-like suppressor 3, partial [Carassius auratus]|uniref:HRAS-like suppressor 3 n=1 Tax=Carassius auratus TaxID=7957 RepID=A0A6P6RKH2_CARAU